MFGKKKDVTPSPVFKVEPEIRASKPSDEDLPEIPELKTWFFLDHVRNRVEYSGHRVDAGDLWITVRRFVDLTWQYDGRNNRWVAQPTTEHVVSVRVSGVTQWGRV